MPKNNESRDIDLLNILSFHSSSLEKEDIAYPDLCSRHTWRDNERMRKIDDFQRSKKSLITITEVTEISDFSKQSRMSIFANDLKLIYEDSELLGSTTAKMIGSMSKSDFKPSDNINIDKSEEIYVVEDISIQNEMIKLDCSTKNGDESLFLQKSGRVAISPLSNNQHSLFYEEYDQDIEIVEIDKIRIFRGCVIEVDKSQKLSFSIDNLEYHGIIPDTAILSSNVYR